MELVPARARHRAMHARLRHRRSQVALAMLVALAAVACGGTGSSPSRTPAPVTVDSAEAAAALVGSQSPMFASIGPKDPELIGQAHWWEAVPAGDGWQVTFRVGWGDCPAGCIDEHTWTYDVTRDGAVTLVAETGPPVPEDTVDGG